eukprot:365894-Chlamydomonas_euryale.AAC.4
MAHAERCAGGRHGGNLGLQWQQRFEGQRQGHACGCLARQLPPPPYPPRPPTHAHPHERRPLPHSLSLLTRQLLAGTCV